MGHEWNIEHGGPSTSSDFKIWCRNRRRSSSSIPFFSFSVKPTSFHPFKHSSHLLPSQRLCASPHSAEQSRILSKPMLGSWFTSQWNRDNPFQQGVVLGWVFPETRIWVPWVYLGSNAWKPVEEGEVKQGREVVSKGVLSSTHLGDWSLCPWELYSQCTKDA